MKTSLTTAFALLALTATLSAADSAILAPGAKLTKVSGEFEFTVSCCG